MSDLRVSFPKPCAASWDEMTPGARGRMCAHCDTLVHDLSRLTIDEAEALARSGDPVCVRAQIGADGAVSLRGTHKRRMVLAGAMTAAMLTAAPPAMATPDLRPQGSIGGTILAGEYRMRVIATNAEGQTFQTRLDRRGRYRIRNLPRGTYSLTFQPVCGDSWTVENVVVGDVQTLLPDRRDEGSCIIVGLLQVEPSPPGV